MKKIYLIAIAVYLFTSAGGGLFASPIPLYWEEVLSLAKLKSPDLRTGEERVELARLNYVQFYTRYLPDVRASASWTREGDFESYETSRSSSYGLSGRVSLFDGFEDISEFRIRRIDYESARVSYRRTASDTYFNLRRGFLDLLWAQESIELSRRILGRRKDNLELVRLKYEAGLEDIGSLLRMEADYHQSEKDYEQAKRRADILGRQLARDIGLDDDRSLAVAGDLEKILPEETPEIKPEIEPWIETIPEHLIASLQLDRARQELNRSRSSFFPELSLNYSLSRGSPDWRAEQERWLVGLNLSIPLFSGGGSDFLGARMTRVRKTIAEENLRQATLRIGTDLHSARVELANAWDELAIRKKYLEASAEQSRIITVKYLNGLIGYLEWHRVENEYIGAQRSMLNAHRDAALALARWLRTLGRAEEELLPSIAQ